MIELDGKLGGGSVLRVGIPLALALGKPIHIINIRHARPRKGLQTQHLVGINMLSTLTGCQIHGATIGSSEITVIPGIPQRAITPQNLPKIQIPTAASVALVIQTLSNYAFAARRAVGFEFSGGGSHVNFSPNFDVLVRVNAKLFELFGLKMWVQLLKPGFYPKGGALGRIYMQPISFEKINLDASEFVGIDLVSNASSSLQSRKIAERQINGFKSVISDVDEVFSGYAPSLSPGSSLSAIIKYQNSIKAVARNGDPRLNPEELGERTARATQKELRSKAAVDEQIADQLLVPLAFSPVGSSYTFEKMVQHIDTNLKVIKQILGDQLTVTQDDDYFMVQRV